MEGRRRGDKAPAGAGRAVARIGRLSAQAMAERGPRVDHKSQAVARIGGNAASKSVADPSVGQPLVSSLNTLRVFEAVARHGSFTRAAAELELTQSAASRQVKALEQFLGQPLLWRTTRQVELTEQGRFYADLIRSSLDRIEIGTRELLSGRRGAGALSIGLPPAFGARWLVPRLHSFVDDNPEITVNLVNSDGLVNFADRKVDVAVVLGGGSWPDAVAERLMTEEMLVVCSPALMGSKHPVTSPQALRHHRLLQMTTRPDFWGDWCSIVGLSPDDFQSGPSMECFSLIVEAAVAALGVALLPRLLIEDELATGRLVAPLDPPFHGAQAYHIVVPKARAGLPRVDLFRNWLRDEAGFGSGASIGLRARIA
jgi:DNA-binding transcriptional LysR family regulator